MVDHSTDQDYEAIIVGAGLGGGATAHTLARAGLKVLVLERGLSSDDWSEEFAGDYAETFLPGRSRTDVFDKAGRATYKVNSWFPVLGGGEGGSTAVYGGVFLRFHPDDFARWPISYEELRPYYEQCDTYFAPCGSSDPLFPDERPLQPAPRMSPPAQELAQFLADRGLHPFHTPLAYKPTPECSGCFGYYCAHRTKYTAANVFIEPAVQTGRVEVRYSTVVHSLIMEGSRCTGVRCHTPGGLVDVRGRWIFLAAGALVTPTLMLNSKSDRFPRGVGNDSDLVGRFLMRHLIDFYYVKTPSSGEATGHLTEVSFSDFYRHNGHDCGVLNSAPGLMSPEIIASELIEHLASRSRLPLPKRLLRFVVLHVLNMTMKGRLLICPIMEDAPSFDNRVLPDSTPSDIRIRYEISAEDRTRLARYRKLFLGLFKPLKVKLLKVAGDASFLAHACGTCRMDPDPKKGVVDPSGRVHHTENLYVVDASVFPTSGGVNPSPTVAALALKISEAFLKTHYNVVPKA